MFECPHCHEKTFTRWQKVLCGSMKGKGQKCSKCGIHCVNGMPSTVFRTIISAIALVYYISATIMGLGTKNFRFITFIAAILLTYILGKVFDAFFGKLAKSVRMDINE